MYMGLAHWLYWCLLHTAQLLSYFSLRPTQGRPILPWRGSAVCYWECGAGVSGEEPLHLRVPWTTWGVSKHHIWSTAVSYIHSV